MTIKAFFTEAFKDAPIVGLGAAKVLGLTLADWTLLLGVTYAVVRLGFICVEFYWNWKDRRDGKGK